MTSRWRIGVVAVVLAAASGCISTDGTEDTAMTVTPAAAPLDEPVAVRLTGLGAGREATVTASATDFQGTKWSAKAVYRAGPDGTLDLGTAPLSGAYNGADPMGLFEFMTPEGGVDSIGFGPPYEKTYDVRLTASVDGKEVASATATRQLPSGVGVTRKDLSVGKDGVTGVLFRPKDTSTRKPAVMVFGGSEGGLIDIVKLQAAVLAAHGYPTLALAYWKAPGLSPTLTGIPLEYFRKGLEILKVQPGVDPDHLFVQGASYGGEAALLVGATYPDLVHGVVAVVPNSFVSPGIGAVNRSAWSLNGKDLPRGTFGVGAADVDPRALIPVQRIRGPILLACGALDTQWPSCRNVDDAAARLGSRQGVTVAKYPDAGHYISSVIPYTAVTESAFTRSGGTVPTMVAANLDLHRKILGLLAGR